MKICILSDTHRHIELERVLEIIKDADLVVHLGDCTTDAQDIACVAKCRVVSVAGNCDYEGKQEEILHINKHIIMCTHGHTYGRYNILPLLNADAEKHGADIVLYGHTHIPSIDFYCGRCFINPGSLTQPRATSHGTYCILELGDDIYPSIYEY